MALLLISVVTSLPRQPSPPPPRHPPPPPSPAAFSGLRNPTTPSHRFSSLRFLRILCFAISARRPPTPRTTGKEHPPRHYLGEIDPSARATLYTVHRREHIASDDIPLLSLSPSALSPDVAAGRPTDRRLARPVSRGSRKRGHYITLNIAFSPPRRPVAHLRRKIDLSGCT